MSASDVNTSAGLRLRGDCADAVRLELDCPQQSLTPDQRTTLSRLSDALEESRTPGGEVIAATRAACAALSLRVP
jgi:hypothetical protein